MKIYKNYGEKRPVEPSNPGTREKQDYIVELDKMTGHKTIKPAGIINTWEKIQASKDASDINNIIARRTRGDLSGFKDATQAIYGDFAGIPDNMIDMANLKLKADKAWDMLPLEIREQYNHDKDAYFADIGSEKWLNIHGYTKPTVETKPVEKEVKVDE